jgi:O-succinylhomoserine sulfhydrylase
MKEHLSQFLRHTGPALSPFNAWLLVKGLETLSLRVQQHCRNAAEVAAFLDKHPKVERALYPGLESHPQHALARRQMAAGGNLVAFIATGGKPGAFRFQNALRIVKISNNLGDAKSLITHPATTTHQRLSPEEKQTLGIDPGLVRLSVGLEDPADVIEDLDRALAAI